MKKLHFVSLCLVLSCLNINAAQSDVLTFEDVTGDTWASIPNGYSGLNWSNFWVIAPYLDPTLELPSGYTSGLVSGDFVAYNALGEPAQLSSASAFDFNSASFAAVWRDGLQITATGYRSGSQLYQQQFEVNTDAAQLVAFNFLGIDALEFVSTGGIENFGAGQHFAMDDVTINAPVPVPAAIWLFGSALLGFAGVARRKSA